MAEPPYRAPLGYINRPGPIRPVSRNGLHHLLCNRYYLGYVTYRGEEYLGRHTPLVAPATFAAVEAVRASHNAAAPSTASTTTSCSAPSSAATATDD